MKASQLVGIDVSAKRLSVVIEGGRGTQPVAEVPNTTAGHRQLARRLTKAGCSARVALEASRIYGVDLALALHRASDLEVMVVNPTAARDFAKALLQRSKIDALDGKVLRPRGVA